jgi:hypothetical protein
VKRVSFDLLLMGHVAQVYIALGILHGIAEFENRVLGGCFFA